MLNESWVNKLFEKLTLTYGQAFFKLWEGVDIKLVKADWAHELSGFAQNPAAISHALQNLPIDKPPTVLQFRRLCIGRPDSVAKLEAQYGTVSGEQMQEAVREARARFEKPANTDWAHRIMGRYERGERINPLTLKMAKEVAEKHPRKAVGI